MLLMRTQAPGADTEPLLGSADDQRGGVDIGCPDTMGAAF